MRLACWIGLASLLTLWACDAREPVAPWAGSRELTWIVQVSGFPAGSLVDPLCLDDTILDASGAPWTGTTQPDCSVVNACETANGTPIDAFLPPCALGQPASASACWSLTRSDACPVGTLFSVNGLGRTAPVCYSTLSCAVLACPPRQTPGARPPGC